MECSEKIRKNLMLIGDKYSEVVLTERKIDVVRKAFTIVEKSYGLIIKMDTEKKVVVDLVQEFSHLLVSKMICSKARNWYLNYCKKLGVEPIGRNEFYSQLEALNFKKVRMSSNNFFIPPADKDRKKRLLTTGEIYSAKLAALEVDVAALPT